MVDVINCVKVSFKKLEIFHLILDQPITVPFTFVNRARSLEVAKSGNSGNSAPSPMASMLPAGAE